MLTPGPLRLQFTYIGDFLELRKWNNQGPFMVCLGFLSANCKDNQTETNPSLSPTLAAWCSSFGKKSVQLRAIYIALVSLCFCASYNLFNVDLLYYMQKLLLTLPHFHNLVSFSSSSQNMPFSVSTSNSSHPIPIAPPTLSTQFMPSNDLSPQEITIFIIWVALLFIALVCFLCH